MWPVKADLAKYRMQPEWMFFSTGFPAKVRPVAPFSRTGIGHPEMLRRTIWIPSPLPLSEHSCWGDRLFFVKAADASEVQKIANMELLFITVFPDR